jgi:hypothetical protein
MEKKTRCWRVRSSIGSSDLYWSGPAEYTLMSERKVVTGERLAVAHGTPQLPRGTRVLLTVRNGFFGSPWIASYKIQP